MTVNQLLGEIQKLKEENKINGNTEILTFDIVKNVVFNVKKIIVREDDGKIILM